MSDRYAGWYACPTCGGELSARGEGLTCALCAREYPDLGGVPCLVPDPDLWRELWASRVDDYLQVTEGRVRQMQRDRLVPGTLPRTERRLTQIIAAKELEMLRIVELLGPLRAGASRSRDGCTPSRPEALGGRLAVLEWYEHVFRDWTWGQRENAQLAAIVTSLAPRPIDLLALYGAGAGRLAFDVHQLLAPGRTVALDLNPLPLVIAERMARGESLELDEFPVAPTSVDRMVVRQRLSAPAPARSHLHFVFADALRPPFAPGSVDAVLTPWFIDAIGLDLRITAAAIHRALKPGGVWIQLGPLNFNMELAHTYLVEEVHEIVQRAGFRLQAQQQDRVPYFDSPFSGSWREETIYGFSAQKTGEATAFALPVAVPPWIADPSLPVPPNPQLSHLGRTSAFTAMALALVDGQRSIHDLALALANSVGVPPDVLAQELRAFFAKLPQA